MNKNLYFTVAALIAASSSALEANLICMDLNTDQGKKDLAEAYITTSNPEIQKWAYSSITDNGANQLLSGTAPANNLLYQSDVSIQSSSSTNTDCIYELIKDDQGQITTYLKFKLTKQ